jgi:hypothetical protein
MRIGTWNLNGAWDRDHGQFLRDQNCDVWLLTEVDSKFSLEEYELHLTKGTMSRGQYFAAIASREPFETRFEDPHPASAMAETGGRTFCSSVLPWRACGNEYPWVGKSHAEKTVACLDELLLKLPNKNLVWGGDWNNSLKGRNFSGSKGASNCIKTTLHRLGLQVPTRTLPHHIEGIYSIDHIAVDSRIANLRCKRKEALIAGTRLSDHDLYWTEIQS